MNSKIARVITGQLATTLVQMATMVVYGAIIVTALVSYWILRLGERLVAYLGHTGIRVLTRIMGLLLAALATQFILTGVQDSFRM